MKRVIRYFWRVTTALAWLVAFLVTTLVPTPVFAIDDPDTPPQVNAVYVYEDLLEEGDTGVLVDYYLDYAVLPTETSTEAYLAIFIDTDNATQLKSAAPYTFVDSGYGRGLVWMYFTATETTSYGLSSTNQSAYPIWLVGNPTLTWSDGSPPKTTASIDYWQTTGDSAVLLALRVLYYADQLEIIWSLDMVETTALGSKLTATGESYFENVISSLRTMAPSAFSAGMLTPTQEGQDYSTVFSAIAAGTNIAASPVTLNQGSTTITANNTGQFTITLSNRVSGNVSNGTGSVTGSPVDLVTGINTVNVTGAGTLIVALVLRDTKTTLENTVLGTGLDLTASATAFGMTRLMFSGLIWLALSIVICAAVYKSTRSTEAEFGSGGASGGKVVLLVFDFCILGGALLGLLHVLVATLLFIGFMALTGYVLFFRNANV